jgi:hypothetical protein
MNNQPQQKYPSLFHIGTQKAGSTYLYNLLAGHPDVTLSHLTEVNFFTKNFTKGFDWYSSQFPEGRNKIDASPKYFMLGKEAAPRIKDYSEKFLQGIEPKFLLILRNPIDYLNSHFQMQLRQSWFKKNPNLYPKISNNIVEFVKMYPQYLERAYYYKILNQHWLKYFNQEQFIIIFFEDFITDYQSAFKEIFTFWGLPEVELKAPEVSKNAVMNNQLLLKAQKMVIGNAKLKKALKSSKFFNNIYSRFLSGAGSQRLSADQRAYLRDIFKEDVAKLKDMLGREVECWGDFK